uniref:Uncharacterized protein n=1 Tax=Sphaerodactylus townsendi TaxID=933632 RepID=A0ACB8FGI4_9SAUR
MYEFYLRLPDEARSLPPPPLLNKGSVYTAFVGWSTALISNAINHRPILAAGGCPTSSLRLSDPPSPLAAGPVGGEENKGVVSWNSSPPGVQMHQPGSGEKSLCLRTLLSYGIAAKNGTPDWRWEEKGANGGTCLVELTATKCQMPQPEGGEKSLCLRTLLSYGIAAKNGTPDWRWEEKGANGGTCLVELTATKCQMPQPEGGEKSLCLRTLLSYGIAAKNGTPDWRWEEKGANGGTCLVELTATKCQMPQPEGGEKSLCLRTLLSYGIAAKNGIPDWRWEEKGVHRQLFYTSVGFYVGHYLMRRASYVFAKRDRDMFEYIERHPEDFKDKEKKKMAEVLENFHPIR